MDIEIDEEESVVVKAVPLQPKWKNPPTVKKLRYDVNEAEPDFNIHVSNVQKWLNLRDARVNFKAEKGQSQMTPKLIRKQNEWRYTALTEPLLASEDMYDVTPQTEDDVDSARDNALILNKQFDKDIDRVNFIDDYVRTAVDEGTVIVRVGWDYEEDEIVYQTPVKQMMLPPEVQQQLEQASQAVQQGQMDPMQFQQMQQQAQGQAFEVDTDQFEEQYETAVVENRPTLEICDYNKVMIDPTCEGNMDKAEFIVYQFKSNQAALLEDPKYSNVEAIVINDDSDDDGDSIGDQDDTVYESTFKFRDKPRKKIEVTEYWGYWDIHGDGTTVAIVATWVGSVMIRLEENPFPDKKPPFVKAVYLPKRRDVYGGEPDAVLTEDNQAVIGAVTRGMIDLMGKSANAQQGISADALDPAQKVRFEQGKDFIFNPEVDPSKAFWMATFPEIPNSAMQMIEYETTDAEGLSGSRPFSSGAGTNTLGSSATAARTASDATAKRELGILRRLSTGIVDIGKKIMAMNAVNLSDEEVIRITDDEWVTINRDTLDGDYDLNVSVSTPEVDQEQAQDLGFMLQTIGPNMDPALQSIILGKIARLKKMPGLAEKIEDYKPEPDPMQEKIKELQAALLEAQVANEQAKGQENQADTRLKDAKAQTEIARARALDSTADKTDLDFVQQKNGTKHRQDMESADQQFDHALGTKAADSMLDKETPRAKPESAVPQVFNANNHYQKTPPNEYVGIDSASDNVEDSLINRQL